MPVLKTRWSIKYDRCVNCGGTGYPHKGKGLCQICYERTQNIKNEKHIQRDRHGRTIASKKTLRIDKRLTEEILSYQYCVLGKSLTDIAKEYNCTRQYIFKLLKKYDIPRRTKSEARKLAIKRKKLKFERDIWGRTETVYLSAWTIDRNFFKSWSPEMAYVLGFIYADGSLNEETKRCDISQKLPEILEKIKALMGCDKRLYKIKNWPNGYRYVLEINDEEIYEDLLRLGLKPAKSLDIKFPEMPLDCVRHFIRGCWDGDGSVYNEKKRGSIHASYISGSLDFIKGILNEFEKAGFPERTIYILKRKETSYSFKFHGFQCQQLYHYLYGGVS